MSRRNRLSSSAYREAALKRAAKALLGSAVTAVDYPGGRSRESYRLTLADGRGVVGTRRDTLGRARRERTILGALGRHDVRVPILLGGNEAQILFQQEIRGVRLSRALADAAVAPADGAGAADAAWHEDDVGVAGEAGSARVEQLLDSALDALDGIQRAASAEGLERHVKTLGDSPTWCRRLIERPAVLGEHLGVPAPALDVDALIEALAVRTPRFVKWDSRPGNALVEERGAVYWFDWEHAGNRNRLDDLIWVLGDEFVPDAPVVEERLLERHVPRFADAFVGSEAHAYVAAYGSFHLAVRLGLILKHVDDAWWSLDRCIDEDRVGVTLGCATRLCRRGARWAARDPLVRPLADWFAACEERLATLVPDETEDGGAKSGETEEGEGENGETESGEEKREAAGSSRATGPATGPEA